MPPSQLAPSAKSPSGRYLSFVEREEIALLCARGYGIREIARQLKRAPSTISRELRRNAATRSGGFEYRATTAQWHADRAARRPKQAKLAVNTMLRDYVQDRLAGRIAAPGGREIRGPGTAWKGRRTGRRQDRRWAKAWSPEQIASRLRLDFPQDETMRVSHETIYQSLYVQGRGALKRELTACLRTGRALHMPRSRLSGRGKSFVTPEVMISERPAEATDRAEARRLIDSIDTESLVGLRDRAFIGLLIYTFARVGAAVAMKVEDFYPQGRRWWVRLHEKGGKLHELPCHHNLEAWLHAYVAAAGIGEEKKSPLFRSAVGRSGKLSERWLVERNALDLVQRKARQAGVVTAICNHTFRATGITAYLENGGTLEKAQAIAAHESPRTTKLYDRTSDRITLDEVERIVL